MLLPSRHERNAFNNHSERENRLACLRAVRRDSGESEDDFDGKYNARRTHGSVDRIRNESARNVSGIIGADSPELLEANRGIDRISGAVSKDATDVLDRSFHANAAEDEGIAGVHRIGDGTFAPVESDEEETAHEDAAQVGVDDEENTEALDPELMLDQLTGLKESAEDAWQVLEMLKPEIEKYVSKDKQKEHFDAWEEMRTYFSGFRMNIDYTLRLLQSFKDWKHDRMTPEAMVATLNKQIFQNRAGETINVGDLARSPLYTKRLSDPSAHNKSTALVYRKKFENRIGYQDVLGVINEDIGSIKTAIGGVSKYKTDMAKAKQAFSATSGASWLSSVTNMEMYSLLDYYEVIKGSWENWLKGWNEKKQLRQAKMSQGIAGTLGKVLPLGTEWETVTKREVEGKNDEAKSAFKKSLEINYVTYDQIATYLEQNKNDGNRYIAVLEYAADHGWLMDLDVTGGMAFGRKIVTPSTWNGEAINQYYTTLDVMNSSGQDNQKKRGKDRVGSMNSIPPIIDVLIDEMERQNYWAAYGILEVMLGKGKIGENVPWFTTTFIRFFRDAPAQWRANIAPQVIDLVDQVGNLTLGHPGGSAFNFIKIERKEMARWLLADDDKIEREAELGNAGTIQKWIIRTEKIIKKRTEGYGVKFNTKKEKARLDQVVAKVLAAQNVDLSDEFTEVTKPTYVNIFEPEFAEYRKTLRGNPLDPDVARADSDYFSEDTDMLMINKEAFDKIVRVNNGLPQHETKFYIFFESIFRRHDQILTLAENKKGELSSDQQQKYKEMLFEFEKSMRYQMNYWVSVSLNDSRADKALDLTRQKNPSQSILVELLKRKMISRAAFMKLTVGGGARLGNRMLSRMMDEGLFSEDDLLRMRQLIEKKQASPESFSALIDQALKIADDKDHPMHRMWDGFTPQRAAKLKKGLSKKKAAGAAAGGGDGD